jgi:hypothetical protein
MSVSAVGRAAAFVEDLARRSGGERRAPPDRTFKKRAADRVNAFSSRFIIAFY